MYQEPTDPHEDANHEECGYQDYEMVSDDDSRFQDNQQEEW